MLDFAPPLVEEIASAFGMKRPTIARRLRRKMDGRAKRLLEDLRGYVVVDQILAGAISRPVATYVSLEAKIRCLLRASGAKVRPQDDACLLLLRRLAVTAGAPASALELPGYREAREAIDRIAEYAARAGQDEALDRAAEGWMQLAETRAVLQYCTRYGTVIRRWRGTPPARLTARLIDSLVIEYRDSSTVFERLLRRLVGVAHAARGESVDWRRLHAVSLADLQKLAIKEHSCPELAILAQGINREVRNVLAHGQPNVNGANGYLEFRKRGRLVAQWNAAEFYRQTRRLSAFVLAMISFDAQLQYVRTVGRFSLLAAHANAAAAKQALGSRPGQ